MTDLISTLNGYVWSRALIYLCLGVGLYFSIRTRFIQVRGLREMIRLTFSGEKSAAGVSSFQALAMSLSGRVGTGNIAGVATAITFGGPGAIFWMWVVAFLGASTAFIESTLAQIYKEKDAGGRYRGGPAYYIEKAMGLRWYAVLFAVVTVIATGLLLPGVQANGIAASIEAAWGVPRPATAAAIVTAFGFLIFGGVARIARFAEIVVPFMALGYLLTAVVVLLTNVGRVPEVLALILRSAFGSNAALGAVLGLAIEWGVKRGVYSSEAGQGTGPHAAAAAEVSHPVKQGLVQALSVYIDTLLVCSATAFMILVTGAYNVMAPDGGFLVSGLPGVEAGSGYTQAAIESLVPGFGLSFVAVALTFFAFTTIVANYYMAETNLTYLTRSRPLPALMFVFKLLMIVAVTHGALRSAAAAWDLGDLGVGLMAWLNIIAILLLRGPALVSLRDFEAQKRSGADPTFDPRRLGIRNATLWIDRRP